MKKLAILSMAFLFVVSVSNLQAQESKKEVKKEEKKEAKAERKALRILEGSEVSVASKNSFNADFGALPNVIWQRSQNFDEATFTKNGQKMTAYYDFESKLVGTTSNITLSDAPSNVQKVIKDKYKNYKIGPVIFFDDNEANQTDMLLRGIQFDDEDNYFAELTKGNSTIMVRVDSEGRVYFFKKL
ncbi:MAG: hypothetical protein NTY07_21945 [Bacteroidia bacterium]|nr:hypothetical protein [Bacteroidia bacterium]